VLHGGQSPTEKICISMLYNIVKFYSVDLKTTEFQTLVLHIYIYLFIYSFIYIYIIYKKFV